jgi:dGTPase
MEKFSLERLASGKQVNLGQQKRVAETDVISAFHKDAEKITTSSAFRRLQGKTQVYPFPQDDFVRNRLTHTFEVAHIGATITAHIMKGLIPELDQKLATDISQIVTNACLLHDIGNPPFGHSGEYSIREFFRENKYKINLIDNAVRDKQYELDLTLFDGNAHGFRVISKLAGWKNDGGLRLSSGTATAMVKYAYDSVGDIEAKGKFGFMSSERDYAQKAFENCGLYHQGVMYRNPLSLIVEASDDIAYLTSDIQDAHKFGDIKFERAKRVLQNLSSEEDAEFAEKFDVNDKDYESIVIGYLRSSAVSYMIKAAAGILLDVVFNERKLINGNEKFDIWSHPNVPHTWKKISRSEEQIRDLCDKLVYRGKRKTSLQVAGGRIIEFVLSMQLRALNSIFYALFDQVMKYPDVSEKVKKSATEIDSVEKYVDELVSSVGRFVSRDDAQIFWGMPSDAQSLLSKILLKAYSESLPKESPLLAYMVTQISLDFVAGTTDRYLSDYSRQWSGPSIM